jgi:hypothetical protein
MALRAAGMTSYKWADPTHDEKKNAHIFTQKLHIRKLTRKEVRQRKYT